MLSINQETIEMIVEKFNEMNVEERNKGSKNASKNYDANLRSEFGGMSYSSFNKELNNYNYYYKNGLFVYEEREEEEVVSVKESNKSFLGLTKKDENANYINSSITVDEKTWKEFNKFCEHYIVPKSYIITDALRKYMDMEKEN